MVGKQGQLIIVVVFVCLRKAKVPHC